MDVCCCYPVTGVGHSQHSTYSYGEEDDGDEDGEDDDGEEDENENEKKRDSLSRLGRYILVTTIPPCFQSLPRKKINALVHNTKHRSLTSHFVESEL
jgi:hypothetical protein